MKRNYKVFSKIVVVNIIVMLHVLTPASAGVGLYSKQQLSISSAQTGETKQELLSSSSNGNIGLFDTSSQSTLTAAPSGGGHGSHVPVADGLGILLMMAGGYLLRRKS
ncbi:MAG: hypothetical protein LBM08_04060 [Dysgonamonadaceae bacterium]|jgi:hypothetical protein|nr:hypothetical protein [Dysgonamonadaceae bacterium]